MLAYQLPACLLMLTASALAQTQPGFRIAITSKGFDYIRQVGIPILVSELSSLTIPDISGSAGTPLGSVDYSLKNIHLSNMKIPTSSIKTGGNGLTIYASGISIDGHADWHYKEHSWPHISDSGSLDMSVRGVTLSVSAIVNKDSTGHPTLKSTSCSINIGSLDVTFHGGASWLYNLFADNIADSVKHGIQSQLCPAATDAINKNANHALETLPVIEKVDTTSEVNYELISDPIFTATYVETQHKGEFLSITNPVEAPISPSPLPSINETEKMMYLWVTDYVANTAGIVYQSSGILVYNVTQDMIPSNVPIKLNTASLGVFIPKLNQMYPNRPMKLDLISTKPPTLSIQPNSANFTVTGSVVGDVILANNTVVNAFVLGLVVYADVDITIRSSGTTQIVTGNCTLLKFDMSLISSNIGTFSIDLLKDTMNAVVTVFVIPLLNTYTHKGLEIPMFDGISFVNPQLVLGQVYILELSYCFIVYT
jgi:lipopolysaccharide-binding protein